MLSLSSASRASDSRRSVVRRAVQIACSVRSEAWDGLAPFLATDLSPFGLFLSSPLALPEGERVTVTFIPPRWPETAGPVHALARVVRASVPRRRTDRVLSGMGLSFEHMREGEVVALEHALRGLPPPLPPRLLERVVARPQQVLPSELPETALLHEGVELFFRAEAPLLTAGARPTERREEPFPLLGKPARTPTGAELRRRHRSYRRRAQGSLTPRHRAVELRLVS